MKAIFAALIGILILIFAPAQAQSAPGNPDKIVYAVNADLSGAFYDPAQNGQGFVIQHIVSNGVPAVLVTWFTYLDGKTRWLVGVGSISGNRVRAALSIGSGADFPPRFVSSAAVLQPWGELTLTFANASAGSASWTSTFPGFGNGSMALQRLTQPASAFESSANAIAACHSGSWYDPAQDGHGVFIEVLGTAPNRQLLAIWYAYLNGEQRWMTATGPIVGNVATLTANITSGADFPPDFLPGAVVTQPWGTMTFTSQGANSATWNWNSSVAGYGSGTMNLTRLTELSGKGCGPASDAEAARFLTQSTFGPTSTAIAQVRTLGYAAWIEQQIALGTTLQRPTIETQIAAHVLIDPRNAGFYRAYRIERWFNTALTAPDQLRLRVAYALSQILVLSDVGALDNNPIAVAEYNDILARNAFGNYRNLLSEVTRSPMMGQFLTSLRNQKTDWTLNSGGTLVPGLLAPDENYAREVMQLFSIGLFERNRDYSPILANGQPIATYTQDLVTSTAKVLTGQGYSCSGVTSVGGVTLNRNCGNCVGLGCQFSTTAFVSTPNRYAASGTVTALIHPDAYRPMVCYPRYADTGRSATSANGYAVLPAPNDRKTLLAGISIAPSTVACHTGTVGADQQTCINYCNTQIDTLVDTLFMHPNVAPFIARQMIQRLTTSNPSAGYIDRVAAVFEDDGTGVRGNLGALTRAVLLDPEARTNTPAANFGKLREPILKLTAMWRAFGVSASSQGAYGMVSPELYFAQRPLGAQTVFNFYDPNYQQPGEIADNGLFSPEFQILDESTSITAADELWRRVVAGYSFTSPTVTVFAAPSSGAYLPPAQIDAIPAAHSALIESLNQKMLYGSMTPTMKSKLVALLDGEMAAADHRRKVLDMIALIAISPQFALQQ